MANWDTASKRYSGMGLGDFGPCLMPIPDGAFTAPDRQQLLDLYSGIAATLTPPVVSWGSPRTLVLASSPTISPTLVSGDPATSYEEVAGATNVLSDANLQIDATTGVITAIDGSGATPVGPYAFKLRGVNSGGNGTTYDLVVNVVRASGDEGGAIVSSAVVSSAIVSSAIQSSAVG